MIIENKSLLSVEDIEKISTLDPAFSAKLKLAIIESGSKSAKKANEK
jgi:hypothetical protein